MNKDEIAEKAAELCASRLNPCLPGEQFEIIRTVCLPVIAEACRKARGGMKMMYNIKGLCPTRQMSGAGFCIDLWPEWKEAVSRSELNQETIDEVIKNLGRAWLDGCGFSGTYDPDNCGFEKDVDKKPGPKARPLYQPEHAIRISWGEWGPEHITVPGNACGLDIDRVLGGPIDGKSLTPHNVDSVYQAHLLLVVFTWIADFIILDELIKEHKNPHHKRNEGLKV